MRRIAISLSFAGEDFHGWQTQENGTTVQAELEGAFGRLFGRPTPVCGCGRTDAGVHARRYVAHLDAETSIPDDRLPFAVNNLLPHSIRVNRAVTADDAFHARFSAVRKRYCYLFYHAPHDDPLMYRRALRLKRPPNVELMNTAAGIFTGRHDFSACMASGNQLKGEPVRRVYECRLREERGLVIGEISADGFLYNMARIIFGTLLYVSDGKIPVESLAERLGSGIRENMGITLPPHGLYFDEIWYGSLPGLDSLRKVDG